MNENFINWTLSVFSLVFMVFILYGCATLVGGTSQQMTFQTEPEGATVKIDGRPLGKTPLTLALDKKGNQTLTFELEGYETISMPLKTTLEPWFLGNVIIGGLIGSTTDMLSGAIVEYAPDQYYVTLKPTTGTKPNRSQAKDFIVAGYSNIIDELNSTSGEYLDSLFTLLNIPSDARENAAQKVKGLSLVYSDIATFAEEVVSVFEKEERKKAEEAAKKKKEEAEPPPVEMEEIVVTDEMVEEAYQECRSSFGYSSCDREVERQKLIKKLEKERRQKAIDAYLASQFGEKKEEYKAGDVVRVEFYNPGVDGAEVEMTITSINEKHVVGYIRRGAAMGGREVSRTYNREIIKTITLKK